MAGVRDQDDPPLATARAVLQLSGRRRAVASALQRDSVLVGDGVPSSTSSLIGQLDEPPTRAADWLAARPAGARLAPGWRSGRQSRRPTGHARLPASPTPPAIWHCVFASYAACRERAAPAGRTGPARPARASLFRPCCAPAVRLLVGRIRNEDQPPTPATRTAATTGLPLRRSERVGEGAGGPRVGDRQKWRARVGGSRFRQ